MGLAALICAYHEAAEPEGGLRATLPLAGRTLIERQARLAASAGAQSIVILVERLTAELVGAIDRLRAEGVLARIARSVEEAAASVSAQDRLLLVGDGVIADPADLSRLAGAEAPAVLTLPDAGVDDRYERIDSESRWAGLALLDGGLLHRTAAMLDDWDLQSTLLRHAIQDGARQFAVRPDAGPLRVMVAERASDLADAHSRIVAGAIGARGDWPSRYLLGPIEHSLTGLLMPTSVSPAWLDVTAAVLTGLGAVLLFDGWLWIGAVLLLIATPLDGAADRLGALRMEPQGKRGWPRLAMPYLAGAALLALSAALARTAGWGTVAIALAALAFLAALATETRASGPVRENAFLAERKSMIWIMLPFALAGAWVAGLGALALYAAGSFFWAQRQVHARAGEP